jgi:FkbM family methyltransferase
VTSNIKELEKIKKDNQALQIQIYPVTIGDQSTTLDFILPPANYSGMGKISTADTNQLSPKIQVEVRPLDSFIDSFRNVRAIFIDVEGYEPAVLKGSKKVIAKFRPTVILEVSSSLLMECGYTSQNIFSFFTENGYVCYNIGRFKINKVSSTADYSNTHTNWICIPIEDNSSLKRIKKLLYIHIFLPLTKIKTEINNY